MQTGSMRLGGWHRNGLKAWAQVLERGYERLVAKDEASVYGGGRTRDWLKVKQANWTEGEHRWRRRLSAEATRTS